MTLVVTMRTADRRPHQNYVGGTLRRLCAQGVAPETIHLCATSPNVAWLDSELGGLAVTRHIPSEKLTPNANGVAMLHAVEGLTFDWLLMLEDDLAFCADFLGSVERWLARNARTDRHVFQFFGFANPQAMRLAAYDVPLKQLRASQAIALRYADVLDFREWAGAHLHDWRLPTPWGTWTGDMTIGWDKFIAAWSLRRWPNTPGMMSQPHFVRHIGMQGSLHGRTVHNDRLFAGESWRYGVPA